MATELHRSNSVPADLGRIANFRETQETKAHKALADAKEIMDVAHVARLALKAETAETKCKKAEKKCEALQAKLTRIRTPKQTKPWLISRVASGAKRLTVSSLKAGVKLAAVGVLLYGAHTLANQHFPGEYKEAQMMAASTLNDALNGIGLNETNREAIANEAGSYLGAAAGSISTAFQTARSTLNIATGIGKDLYQCHTFEVKRIPDCVAQ